jgi:hypothetical protein
LTKLDHAPIYEGVILIIRGIKKFPGIYRHLSVVPTIISP